MIMKENVSQIWCFRKMIILNYVQSYKVEWLNKASLRILVCSGAGTNHTLGVP